MFFVLVRALGFTTGQKRSLNIRIQRVSQKPKGIDAATSQELTGSRDPWRPRKPLSFSLVVSLHADFIPTLISLSPYAQHRK